MEMSVFDGSGVSLPVTPSSSPMPRPALPAANLLYNGASSYSSPYSTLVRTLAEATVPVSIQIQI